MRFPEWARNDKKMRIKFMCQVMCLHIDPNARMGSLAAAAGVHYQSALRAQEVGRMTYRMATSLASAAAGSGVKAIWLMAPEALHFTEDGEVIE